MIHANRLALIRSQLQSEHRLRVNDLAKQLDVAEETIRRDLKYLESLGELRRIHGGALANFDQDSATIAHSSKSNIKSNIAITSFRTKDQKMANRVIQQIQDGMSLFLAASSINLAVAQRLSQFKDLKIFSNALPIAQLLADDPRNQLYMIPGKVRRHDHALLGAQSLEFIAQYHYDLAVMGVYAVSLQHGLMDENEEDAFLHRKIIENSHQKIVLADELAFHRSGFMQRCGFEAIDQLITTKKPAEPYLQQLDAGHVQLLY